MYMYIHLCVYAYMHIYIYTYTYIHIYIYIYICIYIYTFIHIQSARDGSATFHTFDVCADMYARYVCAGCMRDVCAVMYIYTYTERDGFILVVIDSNQCSCVC